MEKQITLNFNVSITTTVTARDEEYIREMVEHDLSVKLSNYQDHHIEFENEVVTEIS